MNYIVIDLEWNQSYSSQFYENPRMPFEIIEIGATKLDSKFNIIDRYGSIIRPRIYRRLHPKIREILNYDENYLKSGRPFDMVFREFKKWCGNDEYIFCTWGPLDLSYLQQNMDYYYLNYYSYPLTFYNLQEIYANNHYNDKSLMPSLEKAVTELKIPVDEPFHSAMNDAYYTALVFQKMNRRKFQDMYSVDYYQHPKSKEEEQTFKHSSYSEYVSRSFDNKKDALEDSNIESLRCYKCNRNLSKKIQWFVNNQNTQLCVGKCWTHGLVCGKIRFKNEKNGKVFVVKTVEKINRKEFERIKDRQIELRDRRKEKRKNKKTGS